MIAKYKGTCSFCQKPITPGVDYYEPTQKRNWHLACEPRATIPFDRLDADATADRLGFIRFDPADPIDAGIFSRWALWRLSPTDRDDGSRS